METPKAVKLVVSVFLVGFTTAVFALKPVAPVQAVEAPAVVNVVR